jgi:lysozyme family protein
VNRDGLKTIIGLLVIGLIIVATFLYGNHQRQAQLRHDEDLKRQQQKVTQTTPQATKSPAASTSPQASVPSSTPNPIQGQGKVTAAPQTGGTAMTETNTTPRTGAGEMAPIALLALIASGVYYRRSRREVVFALVPTKRR